MRRFLHLLAWLCLPSVALMAQDTTASRFLAYSDGGETILFNEDSTNFYYGALPIGGRSYHALWHDPATGDLIALIDSVQYDGNRNFYKLEPFTGAMTPIYDPLTPFLASAEVTPGGRVFGLTGHGGTQGEIYEYDLVNQTTTPFAVVNLAFDPGNSATNLTYDAASNELWIFAGLVDSMYRVDVATASVTKQPANLGGDATLKATYYDGNQLFLCSDQGYVVTPSVSFDSDSLAFLLPDYLAEIVLLDLVRTPDSVAICAYDSVVLEGRFQSLAYMWYRNDTATGITTQNMTATQPGTYRLLVQTDDIGDFFMWSEPVVVAQLPTPTASIVVPDTLFPGNTYPFYIIGDTTPGLQVVWDFGNGDTLHGTNVQYWYINDTFPVMSYLITATISVGNCTIVLTDTVVHYYVGIDDRAIPGIQLDTPSPNPVSDVLNIQLKADHVLDAEIEVLNALGQRVAVFHQGALAATSHRFTWDARGFSSGMYMVRVSTEAGALTRRVMVQH